jgi:hypothetical protein
MPNNVNTNSSQSPPKIKRYGLFRIFNKKNKRSPDFQQKPETTLRPRSVSDNAQIPSEPRIEGPSIVPPVHSITRSVDVENLGKSLDKDREEAQKEEKLPASVMLARDRLNKAAEQLKEKIPNDIQGSTSLEVKGSADVNSLADNIGSAMVMMMDSRKVEQSKQSRVQALVIDWAKKTIPFVQQGLTIANVKTHFMILWTDDNRMRSLLHII